MMYYYHGHYNYFYAAISLNFGNPDNSRNIIAGVVALVVILVVAIILIVAIFSITIFIYWKVRQ